MTLDKYIAAHYGGNKAAFAAAIGWHRQNVNYHIAAGAVISSDGKRIQSAPRHIADLPKPPQKSD